MRRRRRRAPLRADRARAEQPAHDPASSWPSSRAALGPRPAAGAGRRTGAELEPPGPLRDPSRAVIESLELRAAGSTVSPRRSSDLAGRREAAGRRSPRRRGGSSPATSSGTTSSGAVAAGAAQIRTSRGVEVPDSNFVRRPTSRPRARWCRSGSGSTARPPATGGTPRGSRHRPPPKALPAGTSCSDRRRTRSRPRPTSASRSRSRTRATPRRCEIPVTLTIQQSPPPITKTQTIDIINPGEQDCDFRNFRSVDFASRDDHAVDVEPVPGEPRRREQLRRVPRHLLARAVAV